MKEKLKELGQMVIFLQKFSTSKQVHVLFSKLSIEEPFFLGTSPCNC